MPQDIFGDVTRPPKGLGSQSWYTVPLSIVGHALAVAMSGHRAVDGDRRHSHTDLGAHRDRRASAMRRNHRRNCTDAFKGSRRQRTSTKPAAASRIASGRPVDRWRQDREEAPARRSAIRPASATRRPPGELIFGHSRNEDRGAIRHSGATPGVDWPVRAGGLVKSSARRCATCARCIRGSRSTARWKGA